MTASAFHWLVVYVLGGFVVVSITRWAIARLAAAIAALFARTPR